MKFQSYCIIRFKCPVFNNNKKKNHKIYKSVAHSREKKYPQKLPLKKI